MKVLTKALIKKSEESAVLSGGFSFEDLMKTAGEKAGEIINAHFPVKGKKIAVVCGNGNNGGDGFVAAVYLSKLGAEVEVILPFGEPKTETAMKFYKKLNNIPVLNEFSGDYDIIIDALFGIGLNRPLEGKAEETVKKINSISCFKAAIDIPSGLFADSGEVSGECIKADLTVTFIAPKPCFFLPDANEFCSQVVIADIGVKPIGFDYQTIEPPVLPKRYKNSHKGTFGTALTITGSYGMAGAAILAARAAYRAGAGIIKAVVCDKIYPIITSAVPEAVCVPVKTTQSGGIDCSDIGIYNALNACKAILIGCGMGNSADTLNIIKKTVSLSNVPIVIDADGINAVKESINILREAKVPIIITPHPGEMARICRVGIEDIQKNRVFYARKTAKENGCIVVLKGANTLIASQSGEIFFNTTGNPGMATAGSGDVLAGILVSLLAQGMQPLEAAKAAVFLHGKAGDKAAGIKGQSALIASDIIESL